MKLVGFSPEVFQEFENEISLMLFCGGCNIHCNFCHMRDRIYDESTFLEMSAKEVLFKNITPMHSALVVSGGEPTLWKESLFELLTIAKGMNLKTKVFSHGLNYEAIFLLNKFKLVDEYSFDIKGVENVSQVIGVDMSDVEYLKSLTLSMHDCQTMQVPFDSRVTMYPGINIPAIQKIFPDKDLPREIIYQEMVQYTR